MNPLTPMRHGAMTLSLCAAALWAAPAHAWTWASNIYTFADCDPSYSSAGQGPGSPKSCSTADATAHAETTYTSMKALVRTSATAPDGDYFAGNIIQDSVVATATDTRLTGAAGIVRFTAAFDGQVSGTTGFYFGAHQAIYNPDYKSVTLTPMLLTTNYPGAPSPVPVLHFRTWADQRIDALVSWDLPVVFGARAEYQIGLSVSTYGANASSDFSHTWTLVGVDAFDAQGQAVAAGFSAASGAVLPAAQVPEPQALLLMLAGLGGLGLVLRRCACV